MTSQVEYCSLRGWPTQFKYCGGTYENSVTTSSTRNLDCTCCRQSSNSL